MGKKQENEEEYEFQNDNQEQFQNEENKIKNIFQATFLDQNKTEQLETYQNYEKYLFNEDLESISVLDYEQIEDLDELKEQQTNSKQILQEKKHSKFSGENIAQQKISEYSYKDQQLDYDLTEDSDEFIEQQTYSQQNLQENKHSQYSGRNITYSAPLEQNNSTRITAYNVRLNNLIGDAELSTISH